MKHQIGHIDNPIIGHYPPGIVCLGKNETYATTGDKWHPIPDGTNIKDLEFLQSFNYFKAKYKPINFEENCKHVDALNDVSYAAMFDLYCRQRYKIAYPNTWQHQIAFTDFESSMQYISMKQLYEIRAGLNFSALSKIVTKQFQGSNSSIYTVAIDTTEEPMHATCECKGFQFHGTCKHCKEALQSIRKANHLF